MKPKNRCLSLCGICSLVSLVSLVSFTYVLSQITISAIIMRFPQHPHGTIFFSRAPASPPRAPLDPASPPGVFRGGGRGGRPIGGVGGGGEPTAREEDRSMW